MKQLQIDLSPEQYHVPELLRIAVAKRAGVVPADVVDVRVLHRTLDCRRRNVVYHTDVCLTLKGDAIGEFSVPRTVFPFSQSSLKNRVVIVGAGPAGLFAALRALQLGIKPIVVERGKPVEERKYDIAKLTREKIVNPDSNWCFGEGGAGTYSDGKLYTRSTKRGDVGTVLRTFVEHGADPDILLDTHAHIGTDRLSGIIANMRRTITDGGGEYHFGTKVVDLVVRDGAVKGVVVESLNSMHPTQNTIVADAVVLATGHSARDIYTMFFKHGWLLEPKPFALGVRVEHPQELINEIQYHGQGYSKYLPPAAYSLTTQVGNHGVFSFCMCPGGVIVPAATADGQQVVNGMSNSRRNSSFANSGIAVTVGLEDVAAEPYSAASAIEAGHVMSLLEFQMNVEERMFHAGGDTINAPSQRLVDFLSRRPSSWLNRTGYMGQAVEAPLHELLPDFVVEGLTQTFKDFDRKMHGFITEEASLLAVESRTSSPVRIPRDKVTLQHPQLAALYPCGEGAGYAGGIVSSAIDGIRCVEAFNATLQR